MTDHVSGENRKALEARSKAAATINTEASKTLQGPALEADINFIAKTYGIGANIMAVPPELYDPANYMDMGEIPDLQTAMNYVLDAQRQFDALPADLRARFNHSPGVLWNFLQDPRNADQAVALGLLRRIEEPAPETPPAPPAPPS